MVLARENVNKIMTKISSLYDIMIALKLHLFLLVHYVTSINENFGARYRYCEILCMYECLLHSDIWCLEKTKYNSRKIGNYMNRIFILFMEKLFNMWLEMDCDLSLKAWKDKLCMYIGNYTHLPTVESSKHYKTLTQNYDVCEYFLKNFENILFLFFCRIIPIPYREKGKLASVEGNLTKAKYIFFYP